jgi:hypothetical protein
MHTQRPWHVESGDGVTQFDGIVTRVLGCKTYILTAATAKETSQFSDGRLETPSTFESAQGG